MQQVSARFAQARQELKEVLSGFLSCSSQHWHCYSASPWRTKAGCVSATTLSGIISQKLQSDLAPDPSLPAVVCSSCRSQKRARSFVLPYRVAQKDLQFTSRQSVNMSAVMSIAGPCTAQTSQVARRPSAVSAQVCAGVHLTDLYWSLARSRLLSRGLRNSVLS